jgi:hypothetical protein
MGCRPVIIVPDVARRACSHGDITGASAPTQLMPYRIWPVIIILDLRFMLYRFICAHIFVPYRLCDRCSSSPITDLCLHIYVSLLIAHDIWLHAV